MAPGPAGLGSVQGFDKSCLFPPCHQHTMAFIFLMLSETLVLTFYAIPYISIQSIGIFYLFNLFNMVYSCSITGQQYTLFNYLPDSCHRRKHVFTDIPMVSFR